MTDFTNDVKLLLEGIGGNENIASVTHCATRMRFALKDHAKADVKKIEAIAAVKGTFTNNGQFQVIIGNDVGQFYNQFAQLTGIESVSKEQVKADAVKNQNLLQQAVANLSEIFGPIIPAIIVGGLILGFRNVLEGIPFDALDGKTIVAVYPFWAGINHFLWLICEAIFHFLPVGITWSVVRKMGGTQILGIVLGITLVSPQLLNAYAVVSTAAADIPHWDFGFFTIDMIGYQAQVLPAIFTALLFVYLERFFRKIIPESISMIFVPLFSLVPAVLFAHTVIGPVTWFIGKGISDFVLFGMASQLNWLFGALFGFLYAPLVITGLHHLILAIDLQLIADVKGTNLWTMVALSNIAQGSAALGIVLLNRGNKKEEQISIPATISAYLGVTEPAMFAINLKYMFPFIAAMSGSACAGLYVTIANVWANSVGVGGLPAILSIKPECWFNYAIGMLIAVIVPFILTVLFKKLGLFTKGGIQLNTKFGG